jgi:hypothetical protein
VLLLDEVEGCPGGDAVLEQVHCYNNYNHALQCPGESIGTLACCFVSNCWFAAAAAVGHCQGDQ